MSIHEVAKEVSHSCKVDMEEAREMILSEVSVLMELSHMGQLRPQDFELTCAKLGVNPRCEEYFIENVD